MPQQCCHQVFLDFYFIGDYMVFTFVLVLVVKSIIGNLVKIGNGPAAVIGDKDRRKPLLESFWFRMGRCGWRMNRKSEDLPEQNGLFLVEGESHIIF